MHTAGFFIAIFVSAIVLAEEPKEAPKSPAAMTAIRERDHAIEMAEQAYRQAKVAAEKRLIGKLKVLMFVATKAGDLDEANRINARMKEAQAVIGDAGAGAKSSADSIDLLKSLDLSRDTVGGKWKSAKGALLVDQPSGLSRLRLRVKAERPYVLRAEFVRTADGGNFAIYLPVANSTVTLMLDPHRLGLDTIDGVGWQHNKTTKEGDFGGINKKHLIEVSVWPDATNCRIVVKFDGEQQIDWSGAASSLGVYRDWAFPGDPSFGLASWSSDLIISGFAIRRNDDPAP